MFDNSFGPDVSEAIQGWMRPIVLIRILKVVANFEVSNVRTRIPTLGMVQPFGNRELRLKPEGERSWDWQMLHVLSDVDLKNGEEFQIGNTRYRVMSNAKWSDYGYISYELVEGYRNAVSSGDSPVFVTQPKPPNQPGDFDPTDFSSTDFKTT